MESVPAQNSSLALRQRILSDPDFDLITSNAEKILEESRRKDLLKRLINDPDLDILSRNADKLLASKQKRAEKKPARAGFAKRAVFAGSLATVTGGTAYAIINAGKIEAPAVVYDPDKIFVGGVAYAVDFPSPSPTPTETPTPTPSPTPEPTVDPKILAQKEIGNRNVAEYFLGDLVEKFKEKREAQYKRDPEYAKRIRKEFLGANQINMLYLGVDLTREHYFNPAGLGRADSIMVISFNTQTFKTVMISLPRDLYSPELAPYFDDPKINALTMVNEVLPEGRKIDSNALAKKIIEDATGLPIDMTVKTNIDFMQGAPNLPGIFDELFPAGLEINVPKDISDPEFPAAYETENLFFKKGVQIMHGKRLTDYGRTRHADNDFGRSERQRQIVQAALVNLFPRILTDVANGDTKTLDTIISALEKQKESGNLFFDTDIIEIARTLRNGLINLRSSPKGIASLGILAANTIDEVLALKENKGGMFVTFGLGYGNTDYSLVNAGYEGSTLKLAGSSINSAPILYWEPLRKRIIELYR